MWGIPPIGRNDTGGQSTTNEPRSTNQIQSPTMSLLMQRKGGAMTPPRLEGKEVLVGPNPDLAKVKGVMFGGRKQFLVDTLGEEGFRELVAKLTPRTQSSGKVPLASSWCEFESLIELDR